MHLIHPRAWLGTTGLALLTGMAFAGAAQAAPNVVVSIKPLHALVTQVMDGVAEPGLLVAGNASPHTYTMRPSDAALLEGADIVFWTGHGMELFLESALDSLASDATVVELAEAPGITLLPVREGGAFEAHDHGGHDHGHDHAHDDHDHDDHDHDDHGHAHDDHAHDDHGHDHAGHAHGAGDMHFWLDPDNAVFMIGAIVATLSEADPDNAETYAANAERAAAELEALSGEIEASLAPIADRSFIVFHDAYQYFETRFGLDVAGSITVSPEVAPGAARVAELRARVAELGATCVFAEPQFEPAVVQTIIEGTEARAGVLDPEGGTIPPGRDHYAQLLRNLATGLTDCLAD
jgi:zinc transport system substrate-binding protein